MREGNVNEERPNVKVKNLEHHPIQMPNSLSGVGDVRPTGHSRSLKSVLWSGPGVWWARQTGLLLAACGLSACVVWLVNDIINIHTALGSEKGSPPLPE